MNDVKTDHLEWSYKEYISFILIYASYEDLEFSAEEEAFIRKRTGDDVFKKMHQIFVNSGQYECLKMILDLKDKYLTTAVQKEDLLSLLKLHFGADGEFSKLEKVLLGFLRNLL